MQSANALIKLQRCRGADNLARYYGKNSYGMIFIAVLGTQQSGMGILSVMTSAEVDCSIVGRVPSNERSCSIGTAHKDQLMTTVNPGRRAGRRCESRRVGHKKLRDPRRMPISPKATVSAIYDE